MPDKDMRDVRVRCDLCFPPELEGAARGLVKHLKAQVGKAVNINPGTDWAERGYVSLERCGHRTGEPCEMIEKHDVE